MRKHSPFAAVCKCAKSVRLLCTGSGRVDLLEPNSCDMVRLQRDKRAGTSDNRYFCPVFRVFGR